MGDTIKILHNSIICMDNKEYFIDFKLRQVKFLLYDVTCDSKTLINEKIVSPKWTISEKSKIYKKWEVFEAYSVINGRKWVVYFTKKYKYLYGFGPWLFVGLPGLVIYASDEMNKYFFEISSLKNVRKYFNIIEPKFSKKMSFNQFSKKAIINNKKRMVKKISKEFSIPEKDVNISESPKYETLDFIEK